MNSVTQCRLNAKKCDRMARKLTGPERQMFLTIAAVWRELADERETDPELAPNSANDRKMVRLV